LTSRGLPLIRSSYFAFIAAAPRSLSTLSLHDALPIFAALDRIGADGEHRPAHFPQRADVPHTAVEDEPAEALGLGPPAHELAPRSEEHTSELQSRENLVCRLLLEKKKNNQHMTAAPTI